MTPEHFEDTDADADTYRRSCSHWSAEHRDEMEAFYALAHADYRILVDAFPWVDWLMRHQARAAERRPGSRLRLLDVACGSGQFPKALQAALSPGLTTLAPLDYDLLDPSEFSITEAAGTLATPFETGARHCCRLQDLAVDPGHYDIAWATHALYAIPRAELEDALRQLLTSLAPGGEAVIAHASKDGHYIRFYERYLRGPRAGHGTPYTRGEDIAEALTHLDATFSVERLDYSNGGKLADSVIEGYLQRCLFDDSLTLEHMLADPELGPYLRACRSGQGWSFAQQAMLFVISR